jgi:hypothetical protein
MKACTILCKIDDHSVRLAIEASIPAGWRLEISKLRMTVKSPDKTLVLTSLRRVRPGDEFSRLKLSLFGFFDRIKTPHKFLKKKLLNDISLVDLLIGVVAHPDAEGPDPRFDVIFAVAQSVDGMIFNGDAMLNSDGQIIVGSSGESEIAGARNVD